MTSDGANVVQWPPIMTTVRDLTAALRRGFDLVQLPVPEHAPPSTQPRLVLRMGAEIAPQNVMPVNIARTVISQGLVGHPIKCPDGALLYKLTTRAP